jgi:hypothetical protein
MLLELREYRPEIRSYLLAHAEELLEFKDSPKELLSSLLLEERRYHDLARHYCKLQPCKTLAASADPCEIDYILHFPDFPAEAVSEMKVAESLALISRGFAEEGFQKLSAIYDSLDASLKTVIKAHAFQLKQFWAYAALSRSSDLQEILDASLQSLAEAERRELLWRRRLVGQLHN